MKPETPELIELEKQLSHPTGETGIEVGEMMNQSNRGMILSSINALHIESDDHVFELGHGNGKHISLLFEKGKDLHYTGLELSETMHRAARTVNHDLEQAGQATFRVYDGLPFPLEDETVNKAFTVNTIYFWNNPNLVLDEFYRVLKTDGVLAIGFAMKHMMEKLPFTGDRFHLYDDTDISNLINASRFELKTISHQREQLKSKNGDLVDRDYAIAILIK